MNTTTGEPLTAEAGQALPVGTPLITVDGAVDSMPDGGIVIKTDNGSCHNTIKVRTRLNRRLSTPRNGMFCYRFAPYTLDRDLAVTGLTPTTSTQIQTAALAAGWKWADDSQINWSHFDPTGLSFDPTGTDKFFFYNPVMEEDGERLFLDAGDPVQFAAAIMLVTGKSEVKPMELTLEQIVGPDISKLIVSAPASPTLRGLIRAATNQAVPIDTMSQGTDAIKTWILENCKTVFNPNPPDEFPNEPVLPPPTRRRNVGPTREVTYSIRENVSGFCNYTATNYYRGTLEVPESVIARGEEAVEDYVREHGMDDDPDDTDDYEYDDHEDQDYETIHFVCSAEEVCEQYQNDHPEDEE